LPGTPYADATDAALAVGIARRDEGALEEAYRRHAGAMLQLATRVLRNVSLAEETVQEVVLRLWSHPERFDAGRGSLRAFVLADIHGRCVDAIRSEEARRRREEHDAGVVPAARPDDPEEQATSQIFAEHVRRALTALPPEQRDAIELAYLDGRSYREAAQILGEPEGTVKSRIRVGLGRLRGVMEESGAATA